MATIASTVARIKHDPASVLSKSIVQNVCHQLGHHWRDRQLDPATTIALFIQQVAHGNVPCSEVRHLAHGHFTASAYCQARQRLPLAVLRKLSHRLQETLLPHTRAMEQRWHGHRTWHIDASSFSMPDSPQLHQHFGLSSGQQEGCGFPTAHILVLFDAHSGMLGELIASPRGIGDLHNTPDCHQNLCAGDLLIGDDCFGSYAHIALLRQCGAHGLFPLHHARTVSFTPRRPYLPEHELNPKSLPRTRWVKSLGWQDQIVEWFKPSMRPRWLAKGLYAALPRSMFVREVRRTVRLKSGRRVVVTIVTTLLDAPQYKARDLVQLRMRRWEVETRIGYLKTAMGMDVLRCRSVQGIKKELAVFQLVYNLVCAVMLEAAWRQGVRVERLSFCDTLKWLRHARGWDVLPTLVVNRWRAERIEPRVVKRRPKDYPRMTLPRNQLRNTLLNNKPKA